jgi:protein-S-isoprenylcysteine O-methyltransferase
MRYAVRAAVVEYLFELWLFPSWKLAAAPASVTGLASSFCLALRVAASVGLVLALAGQFVRSAAMWTAGVSFTHLVAHHKRPEHVLITSGVYAWSRHPSYAGWFVWAVALQAMLLNPFCLVAYAAVAWKFFDARIRDEEEALIRFFGEDYRAYMRGVPTRIPLIK